MVDIAKAREEFEAAARELVELNKEAQRTRDFSQVVAASERVVALQQQLTAAEAAGPQRVYDPVPLSAPVERKLRETFAGEDQAEAASLLERECGRNLPFNDPPNLANLEQIRLAVIELSGGKLPELRRQIAVAKEDWREVLIQFQR